MQFVSSTYSFTSTGKYEEPQWGYEPRLAETLSLQSQPKDEETGYGYFGARYMDHELMTMWLSVDPMSDKYPGISPYAYCAWNPVKLVDPNGRDIWKLDTKGNVTEHIENKDYDQLQVVDAFGNTCSSEQYEYGTITEMDLNDGNTYFKVNGDDNAKELFEFLAGEYNDDNDMPLEWSRVKLSHNNGDNLIGTSHKDASTNVVGRLRNHYGGNTHFALRVHNHPAGSVFPNESDKQLANGEDCYIYTITNGYIQYNVIN